MGERSVCNNPSEGWWDIRVTGGVVNAEFGAGPPGTTTSYIDAFGTTPITDGLWHHVVVQRGENGVTITTDGQFDSFTPGPLADIEPVEVPFGINNSPCINGRDGTDPLHGSIDEVSITR
jgi:hypothetical protein